MPKPVALYTLILNDGSGQYYGGQTIHPDKRHRQHKRRWPNCEMIVQGYVPDVVRWQDAERAHISMLRDYGFDLANKNRGGTGPTFHTSETLRRMSAAQTGKTLTPEHRKKISAAHAGKTLTPEHRKKLSAAHAGKTLTPEHRKKMSEAQRNRTPTPHTPESRKKRSDAQTTESRKKMSDAHKGIPKSPEIRQKMSDGQRRAWARRKAEAAASDE